MKQKYQRFLTSKITGYREDLKFFFHLTRTQADEHCNKYPLNSLCAYLPHFSFSLSHTHTQLNYFQNIKSSTVFSVERKKEVNKFLKQMNSFQFQVSISRMNYYQTFTILRIASEKRKILRCVPFNEPHHSPSRMLKYSDNSCRKKTIFNIYY